MDNFWRMVFEHEVSMILMPVRLEENGRPKCHQYWPKLGSTYDFKIFTVKNASEN